MKSSIRNTQGPPPWLHRALLVMGCVLLALVQMVWAGYQLGVGNQGIQIAFLHNLHNAKLFANDRMVAETLTSYPSFFFHVCSHLLSFIDLPRLYLTLHLLATAGVFAAVGLLSRRITGQRWVPLVVVLFLLAGHHYALAGESLYSPGFTHTWAVFPLSLLALLLFYRSQYPLAFLLLGLIFNFHALEAGHLLLIMGFAALMSLRRVGLGTLAISIGLFALAAAPTLLSMLMERQPFGEAMWLDLMRMRSADHSFPSRWWQIGHAEVPRLLCIIGLAVVAWSYRLPHAPRRLTLLLAVGTGLLFVVGWVFTEVYPVALVVRAQFFRLSRVLFILAAVVIAHGCVGAWRMPWHRPNGIPKWSIWMEFLAASLIAATMTIPSLVVLLPLALVVAIAVALINRRLAWHQALIAGTCGLFVLLAWQTINFEIPGLNPVNVRSLLSVRPLTAGGWVLLSAALVLSILAARRWRLAASAYLAAVFCGAVITVGGVAAVLPRIARQSAPSNMWEEVQTWARSNTPENSVFLTPFFSSRDLGSFRTHSQRSVVSEWRDGTQLYFNADFARIWEEYLHALQPELAIDADKRIIRQGPGLESMHDEKIMELARRFGADFVVLPKSSEIFLEKVFENAQWAVYRPKMPDFEGGSSEASLAAETRFLQQVALPNIQKHRKSDVRIQVVDAAGRPVSGVAYVAHQSSSAFGFGASLPYFKAIPNPVFGDPKAVAPQELLRFLEVFNYSVIPFSGQWRHLEPVEGQRVYDDLDAYVDWCQRHGIAAELRFVAGHPPAWLNGKLERDQPTFVLNHARDLASRYGGKITNWQVISEGVGGTQAPTLFAELRKLLPNARLGISDDARFWSVRPGMAGQNDMLRGLDLLRDLRSQGVKVDFFAFHARKPLGLWAGGEQIYEMLDEFEKTGVRIHITDFGVAVGDRIEGSVRNAPPPRGAEAETEKTPDERWTPELRAEYYARFFTICYSHPAVDVVNVAGIGADAWLAGQSLLGDNFEPTPAFSRLRNLITRTWRTHESGSLGIDGAAVFRGFHGDYEFTLTLGNGRKVTVRLTVAPAAASQFRFVLDETAGTLTLAEGP